MGLLDSYGVSRVPHYLGVQIRSLFFFQLRGYHPLWLCLSSRIHLKDRFVTSRESRNTLTSYPTTPRAQRLRPMAYAWFGLFRFRSPLLTESHSFSFPGVTEMFHFTPYRFTGLWIHPVIIPHNWDWIAPFGNPRVKAYLRLTVAYRSLLRPSSPLGTKASTCCT